MNRARARIDMSGSGQGTRWRGAPAQSTTLRRGVRRAGRCWWRPRLAHAGATLVLEDRGLPLGAPAIAAGFAVGADHAMARHDQRDRVGGAGLRHRSRRGRPADRPSHLLVGAHLAVGNRPQRAPHLLLERGAPDVDRRAALVARRELPADRGDVRAQAGVRPGQLGAGKLGREIGFERAGVVAEHHAADAAIGGGDQQLPERRRRDDGADALARRRRGGRRRASCRDGGRPVRRRRGSNP